MFESDLPVESTESSKYTSSFHSGDADPEGQAQEVVHGESDEPVSNKTRSLQENGMRISENGTLIVDMNMTPSTNTTKPVKQTVSCILRGMLPDTNLNPELSENANESSVVTVAESEDPEFNQTINSSEIEPQTPVLEVSTYNISLECKSRKLSKHW